MAPRPNLFLIGAMKSGTTSLDAYLGSHPSIFMAPPKEPTHFVDGRELIELLGREFPEWTTLYATAHGRGTTSEPVTA